jgi:hypothetical protein
MAISGVTPVFSAMIFLLYLRTLFIDAVQQALSGLSGTSWVWQRTDQPFRSVHPF